MRNETVICSLLVFISFRLECNILLHRFCLFVSEKFLNSICSFESCSGNLSRCVLLVANSHCHFCKLPNQEGEDIDKGR